MQSRGGGAMPRQRTAGARTERLSEEQENRYCTKCCEQNCKQSIIEAELRVVILGICRKPLQLHGFPVNLASMLDAATPG
jgi:hypothetical protein